MTRSPGMSSLFDGLVVDNFAGGGGASLGIELGLRRPVDVAINHDAEAIAMHEVNHPYARHYRCDVWEVDPLEATRGRPVDLAWFSPDCKHHSRAKGGKPVDKRIRSLAWVVLRWAAKVKPRVIMLENVQEFVEWGPLTRSRRPCKRRRGMIFARWRSQLEALGYEVQVRKLRACDYGAPTIRERVFIIARCDGQPIVWPTPTLGPGTRRPWPSAAECIDWSIPCPSIFGRKRPLAKNTKQRIARGIQRYVLDNPQPFLIPLTHHGDARVHSLDDPMRTVTGAHRGEQAMVTPFLAPRYGERPGQEPRTHAVTDPLPTIVPSANGARLVAAFMAQHNTGMVGHHMTEPVSTIVGKGCTQALVHAHLLNAKGTDRRARALTEPSYTQTAGGNHQHLVAALMAPYYSNGSGKEGRDLRDPAPTLRTHDHLQLITVRIEGVEYVLTDIGMRMLTPRELYRAQGFPDDYVIDRDANGRPFTKTAQVRMVGNSVAPLVAKALVEANVPHLAAEPAFLAAGG